MGYDIVLLIIKVMKNRRASFPRLRYDQLISFCWTEMLPLTLGFIILIPCLIVAFEIA